MSIVLSDLAFAKRTRDSLSRFEADEGQSPLLLGLLSQVNHITRVVRDADISLQFYQHVIGAKLINRPEVPVYTYFFVH